METINLAKFNNELKCYVRPLVLGLFVCIGLTSCIVYKSFEIDVLKPASYSVPIDVKSVVVADNSYRLGDSVEVWVSGKGGQYIHTCADTLPKIALGQLYNALKARQYFDTVCYRREPFTVQVEPDLYKPISYRELRDLDNSCNVDAAIILNSYEIVPCINYKAYDIEVDGYYHVSQTIKARLRWLLIDLRNDSVLDVYDQIDSLTWDSYTDKLQYPILGLPSFDESIVSASEFFGYYYSDRVSPNWEKSERYYYSSGAGYFGEAEKCLKKNKWEEAGKIWFALYKNAKGVTRSRLAHNIAVSFEMIGDFSEASKWSFQSVQLYDKLSSLYNYEKTREDEYYKILVKRSLDMGKLQEQIGG